MTDTKPRVRITTDGFINFASRIGTSADKGALGRYLFTWIDQMEIEAAYRVSWFRKICDIIPGDEIRAWRTWAGADKDQNTLIYEEEKRLGYRQKIREARILARKDGGAAILMGAGGNASRPLDPERVIKGQLEYLSVCSRFKIQPGEMDRDPASPTFGKPSVYHLSNGENTEVHPSRVIRFLGNPIRTQYDAWNGWGDSVFVELRDDIARLDQIAAGIASMVDEAKVDVIKLKNLMANLITPDGEAALIRRWGIVNTLKSTVNALIMDADDEFEQKTLTFQGLTEIQMAALQILSGKSDIPATRLAGQAPQGMNATGDSDMRNYYDRIKAGQENDLGPEIAPMDEVLIRSTFGNRPKELYYKWNPLYSLSEKEAMDVEKVAADTIKVYADLGVIPDTAVTKIAQNGIIERGQWPGAEDAFKEAEDAGEIAGLLEEPTEAELAAEAAQVAVANATVADPTMGKKLVASNDAWMIAKDATPRTLYVRRDVVNKAEIEKWARKQGFTAVVPDMHVTIMHSDTPVDWMKVGDSWSSKLEIGPGGARLMEMFGPEKKTAVLLFNSSELRWRHEDMVRNGAKWDWPEYQPHITIEVDSSVDLSKVDPYQGKIVLGPEIFDIVREE